MSDQKTYQDRIERTKRKGGHVTLGATDLWVGVIKGGEAVTAPRGWKVHSVAFAVNEFATAVISKGRSRIEACVIKDGDRFRVDLEEYHIRTWIEPRVPMLQKRAAIIVS